MDQKQQVQYISGNVTSQFSDSLRGRMAYNNSWRETEGLFPAQNGTEVTLGQDIYGKKNRFPELVAVGQPGLGRLTEAVSA